MYPPSRTINFGTPVAAVATRMTWNTSFSDLEKGSHFCDYAWKNGLFARTLKKNGMPVSTDPSPVYISTIKKLEVQV